MNHFTIDIVTGTANTETRDHVSKMSRTMLMALLDCTRVQSFCYLERPVGPGRACTWTVHAFMEGDRTLLVRAWELGRRSVGLPAVLLIS